MSPSTLLRSLLGASAAALLVLGTGCASTAESREDDGALLLATPQYELHLVEGKVYQVIPVEEGGAVQVREVDSYDKFRDLYRVEAMRDLPATAPERGIVLDGWVGLECVRKGYACGRMPERGNEYNMLELRVVFPD